MASVDPKKINEIRTQFGWSAGELGNFLGRAKATIYYWENGDNPPGEAMSALLDCLHREMELRKQQMSAHRFEEWVNDLKEKKVNGFLRDLQTGRPNRGDGGALGSAGDLELVTDEASNPVLCLLPFEQDDFEELVALLSDNESASRDLARLLLRTVRYSSDAPAEETDDVLENVDLLNG